MPQTRELSTIPVESLLRNQETQIIDPDLAESLSLPTLQAYAYAIYTSDQRPSPISPAGPVLNGQRYFFLLQRNEQQKLFGNKIPPNLESYYYAENGMRPSLSSFNDIAGFFLMHEVRDFDTSLPPVESAHLIQNIEWPHSGPILDFGSFTPNPITSHYEKMFTLRKLLSSAFEYASAIDAQDRMFVVMSARIRQFVAKSGVSFEVLGGTKNSDAEVQNLVYNQFPGYWNDDPLLCRFTSIQT